MLRAELDHHVPVIHGLLVSSFIPWHFKPVEFCTPGHSVCDHWMTAGTAAAVHLLPSQAGGLHIAALPAGVESAG